MNKLGTKIKATTSLARVWTRVVPLRVFSTEGPKYGDISEQWRSEDNLPEFLRRENQQFNLPTKEEVNQMINNQSNPEGVLNEIAGMYEYKKCLDFELAQEYEEAAFVLKEGLKEMKKLE